LRITATATAVPASEGVGAEAVGTTAARLAHSFETLTASDGRARFDFLFECPSVPAVSAGAVSQFLAGMQAESPFGLLDDLRQQNLELQFALHELEMREQAIARSNDELVETNRGVMAMYEELHDELDRTNRGVVALYAELDERADQLVEASEARTRFFNAVSHEFRTPINSIVALANLLSGRVDGELTDEQERQVDFISRAAQQLLEMVSDLLEIARLDSGRLEVRPEPVRVGTLLSDIEEMLGPLLAGRPVALLIDDPPPDIRLRSDPALIVHVLRNLVSNAIGFTSRGWIRVTTTMQAERLSFVVADTGIGIDPVDLDRIFEEFYRGANSSGVSGTGLGLSLARRLARALGGDVTAASAPGAGATFTFDLPVRDGAGDSSSL
jgi:signal transduction histidine kinase